MLDGTKIIKEYTVLMNGMFVFMYRLDERQSEFKRMSYSDGDRVKWEKLLTSELISSDESEIDDDKAMVVVKELVWRSDRVTNFFAKLDNTHEDCKSEQAKRQTKPRIRNGTTSARVAPAHLYTFLGFEQLKLPQDFQDAGLCLQVMTCLISFSLSNYIHNYYAIVLVEL